MFVQPCLASHCVRCVQIDVAWTGLVSSTELLEKPSRELLGRRDLLQCSPLWGQCGGKNWNGAECCASGSSCQNDGNVWYSQCKYASVALAAIFEFRTSIHPV